MRKATKFIRGETPNAIQRPTPAVRRKPDKGVPRTSKFGGTVKDEATALDLATEAYDLYSQGDGQTEYECIEEVYDEYVKKDD